MEKDITNLFYAAVEQYLQQEYPCETVNDNSMQIVEQLSSLMDDSCYVIDILARKFVYVAPRLLLLCGRTPANALVTGYGFYRKVICPDDLQLFIRIHQVMLEYLFTVANLSELECIRFNIRLNGHSYPTMIDHKVVPLPKDKPGLLVCKVTRAVVKTPGNLTAYFTGGNVLRYSFESRKWRSFQEPRLTPREKEILNLARQGKTGREIADMLCLAHQTVRNHESRIYEKLDTNNLSASVIYAINHRLL